MSKCKSCGADIKWLKTTKGKNIPVNLPAFKDGESAHEAVDTAIEFDPSYMIAHFATCPQADQHRKKQ